MKAKYKIGVLLVYTNGEGEEVYQKIKAVVHHATHSEYLMENEDHVSEDKVQSAYAPLTTKKVSGKKRAPRKAKAEAQAPDEAAM